MKQEPITIYSSKNCTYCRAAKQLLQKRGISFEEIDVSTLDDLAMQALFKRSSMKTIPQIFHGQKLIGGFTELSALDKEDSLVSLQSVN